MNNTQFSQIDSKLSKISNNFYHNKPIPTDYYSLISNLTEIE